VQAGGEVKRRLCRRGEQVLLLKKPA